MLFLEKLKILRSHLADSAKTQFKTPSEILLKDLMILNNDKGDSIKINLNNVTIDALLDSGATVNCFSPIIAEKTKCVISKEKEVVILANNEKLEAPIAFVDVQFADIKISKVKFFILNCSKLLFLKS
jgi:hypothetical protein